MKKKRAGKYLSSTFKWNVAFLNFILYCVYYFKYCFCFKSNKLTMYKVFILNTFHG